MCCAKPRKRSMSNSAKQYANFQYVSFVSASEEVGDNPINSGHTSINKLSGEEASLFYKEVISEPSSAHPNCARIPPKKAIKNVNSSKYQNSRLTIFHHAQNGNIEGIKYFLSIGCEINVTDIFGWTPLMCAVVEGHYAIAEYLIENGADLDVKNKQGQTASDIAIMKNHGTLIELLRRGVVEKVNVTADISKKDEFKYCNICEHAYKETVSDHESSIVHLLSCKRSEVSTFYHIPENNKGFQIMLKKGWDRNRGLGADAKGRKYPIKTVLKSDRTCIGRKKEVPKVTHFGPNDYSSVKKHSQLGVKIIRERTYKKWQLQQLQKSNRRKEINFRQQFNME